jgi:peptide/nickel transport system permease protein
MIAYVIQRALQAVAVMVVVSLVSFMLFNFVGDPVDNMVGQEASYEERVAMRDNLGLNDPFLIQFGRFMGNAMQGEFGISYRIQRPVADLIAERMPATLELVIISAILSVFLGIPMGIYTGIKPNSWLSRSFLVGSLVGVTLPTFVIGILLIYIFAVGLGILPSFGRGEAIQIGWWSTGLLTASGWKAIIMPSVTLALFQMTIIMRLLVHGARTVLRWRRAKPGVGSNWTDQLLARRPTNVVLVAMANKTARVAWALLRYERIYQPVSA